MLSLITLALSTLSVVSAAPIPAAAKAPAKGTTPCPLKSISANCTAAAANAAINFPAGETNVTAPAGQTVEAIFVGRGTQNYTCSAAGTWSQVGAMATLFDVTCLNAIIPSSAFYSLPSLALALPNPPNFASSSNPLMKQIAAANPTTGIHYFKQNTPNTTVPFFDFSNGSEDSTKFVTASKVGSLTAPSNPTTNVPWLQLNAIAGAGTFAKSVLRVDTAGGQPTGTCTSGQTSNVDYAALYYFYH